jgi:uncharacterized SAM-binding protein YcdF (DUF218 family)
MARTGSRAGTLFRRIAGIFAALLVITLAVLGWRDDLLIASDPTPSHVDAAVVLEGSVVGYQARLAGGIALAERGVADRVLLSLPHESYWHESIPPIARAYLERTYGAGLASRVDFCEMGPEVDSTEQESEAALGCIEAHHWRSIVVVTSNYHTRRAGILWRRTLRRHDSTLGFSIHGVDDPEFQKPWWKHRQAAKIWLGESEKLVWTMFGG